MGGGSRKRRVEREAKLAEERRELEAKRAAAERDKRLLALWANVERAVRRCAAKVALSAIDTTRLVGHVEREWKQYLDSEQPAERFDYVHVLKSKVAELQNTLAPMPKTNPGDNAPTTPEDAYERGKRLTEQVAKDRQAYKNALKRHGLEDPALGTHRTTGRLGF